MGPAVSRDAQPSMFCAPFIHGFIADEWEPRIPPPSNCDPTSSRRFSGRFNFLFSLLFLAALPVFAQPVSAPTPRFTVVLDAAHGGDDSGSTILGSSTQSQAEKAYTLALSVRLRSLLAARGISVVTTRESDTNLDDLRRTEIANHAQAQACITLHAATSGSGVHLFLSSLPPAQPARFMPFKTAQAAYVNRSIALAGVLNSAFTHAGVKVTLGRTALNSIDSMTCPAVAVEISPDAKPESDQTHIAEALAAGLLQWRSEPRQP